MEQSDNAQCSIEEDLLEYILEELIGLTDNSFNPLSCSVAATEVWMGLSCVPLMGWSGIASSSQPVFCGDSNSNITTNITSIENMGSVNDRIIVLDMLSLQGLA